MPDIVLKACCAWTPRVRRTLLLLLLTAWICSLLTGCMLFANLSPVASIQASSTAGPAPLFITLDAGASDDPDGAIVRYEWAFGDGTTATQIRPEHAFPVPGSYTVTLTVVDNHGASATSKLDIDVSEPNRPPVAVAAIEPSPAVTHEVIQFDASGSYDADDPIVSYAWDFGDGATASSEVTSYAYTEPGSYTVSLLVIDATGSACRVEQLLEVRVGDLAPQPVISASAEEAEVGTIVRFDATDSFDQDGVIVAYAWEFGDGETSGGDSTAHSYAQPGSYRVQLTVTDDSGLQQSVELRIQVHEAGQAPAPVEVETITRTYNWAFAGRAHSLTFEFPSQLLDEYRAIPRGVPPYREYDAYVLDPNDDALMQTLADELTLSTYQSTVEQMLIFVQTIVQYTADPGLWDFPRFPMETLVDGIGDCEDSSILYASLIRALGYRACLAMVDTDGDQVADHVAVFVPVADCFIEAYPGRTIWEIDGQPHAFAETAVTGGTLALGIDPWGLEEGDIQRIWEVASLSTALTAKRRSP